MRQLRFSGFVGAVAGMVAGNLAAQRLPGTYAAWVATGGLAGLTAGLAFTGAALVASGLRVGRRVGGFPAGSLEARGLTSYPADTPALYDDLSLAEQLEYVARLHGAVDWEDRSAELLDRLGMTERSDDPPNGFSKGMRQKASIALAFVRPFGLLLADEPFDGLDPPSRAALDELVDEAAAGGAAIVLATHQLEVVRRASRCLAIDDGRQVYDGPVDSPEVARLMSR